MAVFWEIAGLGDRIRDGAFEFIQELKAAGWSIGILSGDHADIARHVAAQLGIETVRAGVTPEEKIETVRESDNQFLTTVMVGDAVNESGALAAATVGIAVHNGAEASLAAAPIFLAEPGLAAIVDLLETSKATNRVIWWNFSISLTYNAVGVGLAMSGLIHPLVAAILMPISSLTVIALSLRAGRAGNLPSNQLTQAD